MMSERTEQTAGWTLNALFEGFANADALPAPGNAIPVSGLSLDSRAIKRGTVFLACAGSKEHGMQYAQAALDAGAAAIAWEPSPGIEVLRGAKQFSGKPVFPVYDLGRHVGAIAARFYGEPAAALLPIAVTGTNGKSSVTHFIASMLDEMDCGPAAIIGTLGNGYPGALAQANLTTPDAVSLQALLAQFRDQGAKAVAIEASSHALDQYRLDASAPEIAVYTNLSRDHLDYHGSLEAYCDAKARLFALPSLKCAVINLDDPKAGAMLSRCSDSVRRIGISRNKDAKPAQVDTMVIISDERLRLSGLSFALTLSGTRYTVETTILGAFNIDNLASAFAVGVALDLDPARLAQALSQCVAVPGRLEAFTSPGKSLVVVDYAHTPAALDAALSSLRSVNSGQLTCVFGCGGDRDQGKRSQMGAIASQADRVVVTNDNPRSEAPEQISEAILEGIGQHDDCSVILDREQAIRDAIEQAPADGIVLVAGKGHECTQEIAGERLPFCDRTLVRRILEERA